jgi:hypothetical protein
MAPAFEQATDQRDESVDEVVQRHFQGLVGREDFAESRRYESVLPQRVAVMSRYRGSDTPPQGGTASF